jgi:hypothetical protein
LANEDVVSDDILCNGAAKISSRVEGFGSTAGEGVSVADRGLNGASAALLGCCVEAVGSTAS